ncbi:hypothetical protein HJC23_003137 [Cyclotella cryptica]|uniref:Peptidase A2 domain-containing protein n=1 Tax=Cyclotella cryptica TaxID=29204 RepID=A0ABD3P570_9STRA|eukprot:CCRYP_017521-RA/>CCRYP_017521-RA protein AED:0.45 eAED:0.32 QI:0/-1/0/1/-1/1/1/0/356
MPMLYHRSRYLEQLQFLLMSTQPDAENDETAVIGVVAPLTYSGPYPCLGLDFHHLNSNASKSEGNSKQHAVSINFVLDTGANVNVIKRDLAQSLGLQTFIRKESLSALGSAGIGGSYETGDIVMMGDCHLSGMPAEQSNLIFMRNLTAASLDIGLASTVADGLLGTAFFNCFPAGVEFDWYGTDGDPPTMIFYYGMHLPNHAKKNAFRVPIEDDSFFGVPIIKICVNGVELTAIVDTGSCSTILSSEAAELVGLNNVVFDNADYSLKAMGIDKRTVDLVKGSSANLTIGNVSFADVKTLFWGDLPGITLAGTFGAKAPQAVVGLDVLKRMYRMILRLSEQELWFEEMPAKSGSENV